MNTKQSTKSKQFIYNTTFATILLAAIAIPAFIKLFHKDTSENIYIQTTTDAPQNIFPSIQKSPQSSEKVEISQISPSSATPTGNSAQNRAANLDRLQKLVANAKLRASSTQAMLKAAQTYDGELTKADQIKSSVLKDIKDVREVASLTHEEQLKIDSANLIERKAQENWNSKIKILSKEIHTQKNLTKEN